MASRYVLIITQYFWPENFRINDLVLGLKERGYKVTVLTGKPNYPGGHYYKDYGFIKHNRDDYHGVDVIRVPLISRGSGGGIRLALNFLSFTLFASLLAPFRCRGKYDVIFVYEPSPITVGLPALLLKWLKKAPILFWVQDLWPESLSATGAVRSASVLRMVEWLVRFIYNGCDRILVQSQAFFVPIERLGIETDRLRYFPNSAEGLYRPVTLELDAPEQANMPGGFRVMFAGNIGAAQDFETILGAAERLRAYPDIHWIILGDGRLFSWVKQEMNRRGLTGNIHLLGMHPVESMPRYFALADAMLVTLKRDPIFSLTIPAKVQSYLASGKPLVAALEGEGARVVREARAGLTPPAENPEALADAVLAMYRMTMDERRAMGLHGRQYFETHFERNMLLDRLDGWIREMTKQIEPCVF